MVQSVVQLGNRFKKEIEDWGQAYNIDLTFDEVADLTGTLLGILESEVNIKQFLPHTCEDDDEHYNDREY